TPAFLDVEQLETDAAHRSRRPKRRSCDAVSGRSVACCLVSFCSTLYLAGIQTEVRVLNGMQPPNAEVHADRTISAPSLSPPQAHDPSRASNANAAISVTETSTSPTPTPTSSEAANGSSPEIGYMIPRADCPKGADQVASLEECIAAAAFLKKKMMSTTPFSAHSDPVGCIYRTTDRDIFFNNHPEGSPNKERRPICKGPLLAVGAGGLNPKSIKPVAAWDQASDEMRHAAAKIRLFCFAWTPFRGGDQAMLAEVTLQYNKCDGHAFFSDRYPGGEKREDVIVVKVPEQRVPRTDQQWLYHRNMVGLMPTWDHLLRTGLAEQYDWVINTELDHFVSPSRCRLAIVSYLQTLQKASPTEQKSAHGPLMLMWGNAFVFNRKMVSLMREQWKHLGTTETGKSVGVGCPQFMRGRQEWPEFCSQDIVYPNLVEGVLRGGAAAYGRPGCGQADGTTRNRIPFQLGCWEMQKNPYGMSEEGESDAIQEFAQIQKMKDEREAMRRYAGTEQAENYKLWFSAKNVPVIHHIVGAEVHKLARELLDPEPEKKKKTRALSPSDSAERLRHHERW
ncbi:unnamed protein product, partial [Effrenium voratum]